MTNQIRVIVVMGVSGCGKSTVGKLIAEKLECEFIEGDEYHPPENIAKMSRGSPLNDADRAPWLASLSTAISTIVAAKTQRAVLACSALKPQYRDVLRGGSPHGSVVFVLLEPSAEEVELRLRQRQSMHFMGPSLLQSQLDTLEYSSDVVQLFMHFTGVSLNCAPEVVAAEVVQRLVRK